MSINIITDISPYLPDIFLKNDVYSSTDKIDYNTIVSFNSTIFIFNNLGSTTSDIEQYDDPSYLLYGIQNINYAIYNFPSLCFFTPVLNDNNYIVDKDIIVTSEKNVPDELLNLLINIGYDTNLIDYNYFHFQQLTCNERSSSLSSVILYFYFNFKKDNSTNINYNYYNSSIYYNNNYWNIFIYPTFNQASNTIINTTRNNNITYIPDNFLSKSTNNIKPLSFNNADIIKYIEKIDYKYMENSTNLLNKNNKINLLKNYSINIKNFIEFYNSINKLSIFISNNEINKLYFENLDYENSHRDTYTLTKLNNNYINNNLSFSNNDKKYSFTMNNKFANIKNKNKYSCYNYDIINIPSIYQITKNYNINSYIDITKEYLNTNNELLFVTNCYLYKILVLIDPYIISPSYLLQDTVNITINDLYSNNNKLIFGTDITKVNLYFANSLVNTDIYYINKYKITYSTVLDGGTIVNYIILLSIIFYNGDNINITNLDISADTNNLGFISYTNADCSVTLSPNIFCNTENDNNIINRKVIQYALYDIKKYTYGINYSSISSTFNTFNYYYSNNFYFCITNFIPNITTYYDNNTSITPNNQLDIMILKVNNLITNIVNINRNISNFKFDIGTSKTLLVLSTVLDTNIDSAYIYNYSYFPKILLQKSLPNTINKYKMNNYRQIDLNNNLIYDNNLVELPAGNYKVLQYNNLFNINDLSSPPTVENDIIVKSISQYKDFFNNNFSLMIKLPDNINVDDKFYYDNYKNNYYSDNYSSNIGYYKTSIYMVMSYTSTTNGIYVSTENIIYGLELFNNYNDITDTNTGNKFKIKMNLLINNYINFYQMNFYAELFNTYSEQDNLILDINNLYQNLYPTTYLKDVVYYDLYRFQNDYDYNIITTQYANFNITIANNLYLKKYYLYQLQLNKNRLIFIFNSIKNLFLSFKNLTYLKQVKNNYLLNQNTTNAYLIELIIYNIKLSNIINYNNYELNITYSTNNYIIQNLFNDISTININTSLETINTYIKNMEYIIDYFKLKINYVKNDFNLTFNNIKNFDSNDFISISNELNIILINTIVKLDIFILIYSNIYYSTFNNDIISNNISNSKNTNILINSIINYILIILLNSNKINELYNLLNLIYYNQKFDIINYYQNEIIIKNNYIYNTTYYNKVMDIQNFNYFSFLSDLKTTINHYANSLNINENDIPYDTNKTSEIYLLYKKSINDGVIKFIDNIVLFFQLINEQIIGIYKFIYNIDLGSLPKINIYDNENISNLYFLLTEFKNNVDNMYNVIISNNINIFDEFIPTVDFFNNYYSDINEYLLYVQLYNDINNINISSTFIPEDILNVLNIDEIYAEIKQYINTIQKLYNLSDLDIINEYLKKLDINIIITNIKLDNVVVYDDYNIVQNDNFPIFNFNKDLLITIQKLNDLTSSVFNYYYTTTDIDFYKQYINYNYITNPLLYVNIQNNY
jgi:hypothetical protein